MLLFAGNHAVMPIDAAVARVVTRLGWVNANAKARSMRMAILAGCPADADAYRRIYLYLAHHAGATCTEHDPHCGVCPVIASCSEGRTRGFPTEGTVNAVPPRSR